MPLTLSRIATLALAASIAAGAPAQSGNQSEGQPPNRPPRPQPPVFVPPKGGGLGGVRMRLPSPHSGGSLLEKRMRPFPGAPQPPNQPDNPNPRPPIIIIPPHRNHGYDHRRHHGHDHDHRYHNHYPYVIPHGASISYNSDGRFAYHGPVIHSGLYYAPSGPYWKYPYSYYRSSYGAGWHDATIPVYQPGTSDRFLAGPQSRPASAPGEDFTDLDRAENALISGDVQDAIANYKAQLSTAPSDNASRRMLGISLILNRQIPEGIAAIAQAYAADPTLSRVPFDSTLFPYIQTLRERAAAAITYAHRVDSSEAYLAAAVLKQAEGENPVALRMLDKAAQLGLAVEIEQPLRAALTNKFSQP